MEAKTAGWALALVVIATFGFVAMFAIEKETAGRDLGLVKAARQEAQTGLDNSRTALDHMKVRVKEARKLKTEREALKEEAARVDRQVIAAERDLEGLKKAWQTERDAFEKSIAAGRQKIVGKEYPRLSVDGQTLEKVIVKSFTGGVLALEHSAGLTRVTADKISDEFVAVLMPEWNPQLAVPFLTEVKTAASGSDKVDPAEEAPAEVALPPASAPAAADGANPFTAPRMKLEESLRNLTVKMDAARGQISLMSAKYYRLQSELMNARYRSRIVTEPPGLKEAAASLESFNRQFETLRRQYNRNTMDLRTALEKEAAWTPEAK